MPTFYVRHPAAGDAADHFRADEGLGAGRFQQILASNASLMVHANARRHLASHPGVRNWYFWDEPLTFGTLMLDAFGRCWDGALQVCLGTHYVHLWPDRPRLPTLHLAGRGWGPAGVPTEVTLIVCPGDLTPVDLAVSATTDLVVDGAAHDFDCTIRLQPAHLAPRPLAPSGGTTGTLPAEQGELQAFTAYVVGKCAGGKGSVTGCVGLSLYLEDPT